MVVLSGVSVKSIWGGEMSGRRALSFIFINALLFTTANAEIVEVESGGFGAALSGADLDGFLERSNCDAYDPSSVCGGEPAAPPTTCVYQDPNQCSGTSFGIEKWKKYSGDSSLGTFGFARGTQSNPPPELNSVVALINDDAKVLCSGTLISSRHVITAAHCINYGATNVFLGSRITKVSSGEVAHDGWLFKIVTQDSFGDSKSGETCKQSHLTFSDSSSLRDEGEPDIGLISFDNSSTLSNRFIERILSEDDLSSRIQGNEYGRFSDIIVAGFGASESRDSGGEKRYAWLGSASFCNVANDPACRMGSYEFVSSGNTDTCFADSGGLVAGAGVGNFGGYFLGATSRASETGNSNLCGKGGVYTSIFTAGIDEAYRQGFLPTDFRSSLSCSMPWTWVLGQIRGY